MLLAALKSTSSPRSASIAGGVYVGALLRASKSGIAPIVLSILVSSAALVYENDGADGTSGGTGYTSITALARSTLAFIAVNAVYISPDPGFDPRTVSPSAK